MGLELVDELSGDVLVGASRVRVFRVAPPGEELAALSFLVGRSRWVFEELDRDLGTGEEARFSIDADHYFAETVETGQTAITLADPGGVPVPSLAAGVPFVGLRLRPRTGYPFPPALTRVVGSVSLAGAPVVGATVTVTPRYQVTASDPTTSTPGTPAFVTLTADDGQYVAWLFPNVNEDFPAPIACDVTATFGAHTGGATNQRVVSGNTNGVSITLT